MRGTTWQGLPPTAAHPAGIDVASRVWQVLGRADRRGRDAQLPVHGGVVSARRQARGGVAHDLQQGVPAADWGTSSGAVPRRRTQWRADAHAYLDARPGMHLHVGEQGHGRRARHATAVSGALRCCACNAALGLSYRPELVAAGPPSAALGAGVDGRQGTQHLRRVLACLHPAGRRRPRRRVACGAGGTAHR